MADFGSIKAKIVTKLEGITDLDQSNVFNYEPSDTSVIDKDPFAIVTASDNEADFGNIAENRRIYGFVIRVYIERNSRGASDAESTLTDLVDAIINAFDQDITLGGEVLMIEAAPSLWQYSLSDKEYRVAEIRISAKVWFDTTT